MHSQILCIFFLWASVAFAQETSVIEAKVVLEDGLVLVFDSDSDTVDFDINRCYNGALESQDVEKNLVAIGSNKIVELHVVKLDNYFDKSIWDSNVSGHYLYQGKPLGYLCSREDLIVIKSVHLKKDK